jgi:hypothetical protein
MARPTKKKEEMTATETDLPEVVETETTSPDEVPAAEAPSAESPAEPEIDLTEFQNAVEAAIAERDVATGVLPEAQINLVRTAYADLDGAKAKNRAKAYLHELLKSFMENLDVSSARAVMILQESAAVASKASGGTSPKPRVTVDPTDTYAEGLAALTLAFYLATSDAPERVDLEKAKEVATAKANELFATAREVRASEEQDTDNKVILRAIKLAAVKPLRGGGSGGGRSYSGPRRDIARHIAEAIAGKPAGTFLSVAELRKFRSEEYGDDTPSAGAITNRLEPPSGAKPSVEGVVVERRVINGKEKLGVVVQ